MTTRHPIHAAATVAIPAAAAAATSAATAIAATIAIAALVFPPALHAQAGDTRAVAATLDGLHQAASEADFDTYFDLFAPNGVFLGTDASERWTVEEFKAYAKPHFDDGNGWSYRPIERHISFSADGETAWFDERLHNAGLGETRGSGVLVLRDGVWKIAQYNLTIPIPNELADEVVARIRAASERESEREPPF